VIFKQYQLACLSLFSYLVGDESTGRAVVVDPQRDVAEYIADARDLGLSIERVIETHVHADFLSGHLELAAATGAAISYGDAIAGRTEFDLEPLRHGQRLVLGEVVLEIRAAPGHTPESICVVIWQHAGDAAPYGVLTGDTLFIGDVGRPDLLVSAGLSADDLARCLYHSLHEQLLTLPDSTLVFPAHGAGSACGKSMSTATSSTIGEQRGTNYALAPMDEDAFVRVVTEGQPLSPAYFTYDASRNREARPLLDEEHPPPPLSVEDMLGLQSMGAVVIDTRDAADFAAGHLRGSINVGLGGRFAEYAGDVVDPSLPIVLVTEPGSEQEAKVRLARIGLDRVEGALADALGGFADHPEAVDGGSRLSAAELRQRREAVEGVQLVDVRNPNETEDGTIPGAALIPIARLAQRLGELDPNRPVVAYCASGYRSSTAASVLRAAGFTDVSDLLGGYGAWAQSETTSRP
jgi:glyoxylase-like metal-dependent hydrolase (beta-lactamase superfamily II)/rhodanese-related sulfurtransferase